MNWVLDADIKGFFDHVSHEWMLKFLAHRVADNRILRLVQKWLKAGVSEDGEWSETTVGTPQGGYSLNAKDNMGQPRASVVAEAGEEAVGPGWDQFRESVSESSAEP